MRLWLVLALVAMPAFAQPSIMDGRTRVCFAGASNMARVSRAMTRNYEGSISMCNGQRLYAAPIDGCDLWRWEGLDGPGYEYCQEAFAVEVAEFPDIDVVVFQIAFKPGQERSKAQVLAFFESFRATYGLEDALFVLMGVQFFRNTCGNFPASGVPELTQQMAREIASENAGYIRGPDFKTLYGSDTSDGCHQNPASENEDSSRLFAFLTGPRPPVAVQ